MPGRVNTKFVLLLGTVIALAVVMLFGVWYLVLSRNPQQLARQGDLFLREGDFEKASESYGKASARDRGSIVYLDKFFDATNRWPINDRADADNNLQWLMQAKRLKVEADPNNGAYLQEYYQYLVDIAEQLPAPPLYRRVHGDASVKLDAEPNNLVARKYRGLAQVHLLTDRGDMFDVPREDQLLAGDDLRKVLEQTPNDTQALNHLARWALFEARYTRQSKGKATEIQRRRNEALTLSRRMLEIEPDDLDLRLDHILILLQTIEDYRQDDPQDEQVIDELNEEASALMAEVEAALLEQPHPVTRVLPTARLLIVLDREPVTLEGTQVKATQGFLRAVQLLHTAAQKHPTTVDYLFVLGNYLHKMGESDQAMRVFQQIQTMDTYAPALEYIRNNNYRFQAEINIADMLIAQRAETDDSDKIAAMDQQIRDIIKHVETNMGRLPALDILEGKLAIAQGDYARGQQLLNRASSETGGTDLRTMLFAAEASRRTGDWGEAARQYEAILAQQPGQIGWRVQLAEIYLQGQRLDDAQRHIEILQQLAGDQLPAKLLHANLLARQNRLEEAVAIYESLDRTDKPQLEIQLAKLYLLQKRSDEATAIVQQLFKDNPKNLTVLQLLLRLTDDLQQQQAYLAQAREAEVDEKILSLLELQLGDTPATQEEIRQQVLDMQDDPFANAVARARQARQAGDLDLAESALAEAAALKPNDPNLIRLRFELAIAREQWDKAGKIVEQASQRNVDLAEGAFYRGDLAASEGDWGDAIAEYEKGLSVRPIYSEGWRRLADVQAEINRPQQAIEAYQRALKQQPNNVRALSNLSTIEERTSRFAEARQHAQEAWRYSPNNIRLFEHYLRLEQAHGDPNVALTLRQQLAKAQPDNSLNQRSIAMLLARLNRYDEALTQIHQLIEQEGTTATNVTTLAFLLHEMGQVDEGEQILKDYISDQGNEATGLDYVRLGQYRMQTGKIEEGIEAYTNARKYDDPEQQEYTRVLADLLFALGRSDDALNLYRSLHQNMPDDAAIALRLVEVMIRTEDYDQADLLIADLQVPAEFQSTFYLLRSILALPRSADGPEDEIRTQQAKALEWIRMSLQADPENASAYFQRARMLAGEPGQEAKAIADLNRALEINHQLRNARIMLVQIYMSQNNRSDAIRELRQMLQQSTYDRAARATLINLHIANNNVPSALALADEAMALQPEDPTWVESKIRLLVLADQTRGVLDLRERLVEMNPTPSSLSEYALALLQDNQAEQVLSLMRQHAEQVNKIPVLEAIRARALAKTGRLEEANRLFAITIAAATDLQTISAIAQQMVLAMGPQETAASLQAMEDVQEPAWIEISIARTEMQRRMFNEVISRLKAIEDDLPSDQPTQLTYLQLLALASYQTAQYQEARKAYEQTLAINPNDVGTMNNLAYLLIEDLDEVNTGLTFAEQAAKANPQNAQILDTLGWGQYKAGQFDDARKTLEQSLLQTPLAPNCLHLAQVYLQLGRTPQAIDLLQQTLRLTKQNNESIYTEQAEALLETLQQTAP